MTRGLGTTGLYHKKRSLLLPLTIWKHFTVSSCNQFVPQYLPLHSLTVLRDMLFAWCTFARGIWVNNGLVGALDSGLLIHNCRYTANSHNWRGVGVPGEQVLPPRVHWPVLTFGKQWNVWGGAGCCSTGVLWVATPLLRALTRRFFLCWCRCIGELPRRSRGSVRTKENMLRFVWCLSKQKRFTSRAKDTALKDDWEQLYSPMQFISLHL